VKILIFSDTHGDLRSLEQIIAQPADVFIAAGDLSNFGKMLDRCGEVLKPLGERLLVLPGNHETHQQTKTFCEKFGFVDFHRQLLQLGNSNWAGLGYSNITPFKTPGEYPEEEISAALTAFDAGSPALRTWVEREKPVDLFCGHIHETAGMTDQLGSTKCFNVGKQGYLLEV
jgi:Icc-related predicted phosphoesterase